MYCPTCGKETLSDAKFCPGCGQAVGSPVASSSPTIPKKNSHPTLSVFIIAIVVVIFQVFLISAAASSARDIVGINTAFGIIYAFLFIIFLVTLVSKPKVVVAPTPTINNVPPANQKNQSGVGKLIIALIFIFGFSAFFMYMNNGSIDPVMGTVFVIIFLALLAGLLWYLFKKHYESLLRLVHSIVKTIKFLIHHPILTIFSTLVGIVLILFIYSTFVQYNYKSLEQALPSLQDNLTEAATAKLMGDSIIAGRWVANMWMGKINETAKTTSDNLRQLKTPSILKNYKESIVTWNDNIASAAAYITPWKNLPEQPADFDMSFNDSKVAAYINTCLQKVALLKEAGDIAIKRQDRQTMYYVAGQLLIQQHWINGLYYSNNPGFLSFLKKIKLVSPVMAKYTGFTPVVHRGPRCIVFSSKGAYVPNNCPTGYKPEPVSFSKIMHAAVEYAEAQPGAEEQWSKEWTADELKVDLPKAGPYVETQGGVYNGEPNLPPQLSQSEQAFVNECRAKGGTTAVTGGVYARMPTTESGMACHHGSGCWDYFTRSNRRYSGGNPGCPEQNLLPPPPPPTATPRPTRPPTSIPQRNDNSNNNSNNNRGSLSWDGNYTTKTSGNCGGYTSGIIPYQLYVRNNVVVLGSGYNAPINSSGNAQLNINVSAGGAVVQATESFNFFYSNGQAYVNGQFRAYISGNGISVNCSGSLTGSRR